MITMLEKKSINLKAKILDLLSRRDYSYRELQTKLQKYSDDLELIKRLLDEMVAKKFINEERYIENFIYTKSKKFGSQKVKYLLQNKVNDQSLVNQIYAESQIDEFKLAQQIWQRKFASPATESKERAKQIRFMLSRGFSLELILKLMAITLEDEDSHT